MKDTLSLKKIDKSKIYILKKYNKKLKKFSLDYVRLSYINQINFDPINIHLNFGNIYYIKFKTLSGKNYYFKNVQQSYNIKNGCNCNYRFCTNNSYIRFTHFQDSFKPNMIYKLYESIKIGMVHKKTVVELTKTRLPKELIEYIQTFI
jgi:hypothetical protein